MSEESLQLGRVIEQLMILNNLMEEKNYLKKLEMVHHGILKVEPKKEDKKKEKKK